MKKKKLWKMPLWLLLGVLALALGLLLFLTITEYRPQEQEDLEIEGTASRPLQSGQPIRLMAWNIGYGALGDNADFFMDGGKGVKTAGWDRLENNMAGIFSHIAQANPDILLIQEIDVNSARSEGINEYYSLQAQKPGFASSFANNFKVAFLPYPVPPIGKVDSGIASFSAFPVSSARRIQLPNPFAWPIRMANLKRCLLIQRLPVEGSEKELVVINLHLEAYDDGEGKIAQTLALAQLMNEEKAKGNYVVAGGDFNQIFSCANNGKYPAQEGKWAAGEIDVSLFGDGWQFLMTDDVPSCRSLDQPYAGADKSQFQYYVIDGFIASGNVEIQKLQVDDLDFVSSDHNPVQLEIILR